MRSSVTIVPLTLILWLHWVRVSVWSVRLEKLLIRWRCCSLELLSFCFPLCPIAAYTVCVHTTSAVPDSRSHWHRPDMCVVYILSHHKINDFPSREALCLSWFFKGWMKICSLVLNTAWPVFTTILSLCSDILVQINDKYFLMDQSSSYTQHLMLSFWCRTSLVTWSIVSVMAHTLNTKDKVTWTVWVSKTKTEYKNCIIADRKTSGIHHNTDIK